MPDLIRPAHWVIPLGWLGASAMACKQGDPWPALGGTLGGVALGALGLRRAYRLTLRFYQGEDQSRSTTPSGPLRPVVLPARLFLERRLPGIPEEAAGLALATFRGLLRAPEIRMIFIMPFVLGAVFAATRLSIGKAPDPGRWDAFLATGAVGLAGFALGPIMGNAFGLDRNGFRALVLLPTPRHYVLLAKNLAFFPFMVGVGVFLLLLVTIALRSVSGLVMGLIQLPTAFLLIAMLSNLSSILAPYRMAPGSLQVKKPKAILFLATLVNMLLLPVISPLLLVPPGLVVVCRYLEWSPWIPVGPLVALAVLPLVAWIYWLLLPVEGRLLQRRERTILLEVTEESE